MKALLSRLVRQTSGQDLIEYALIAAAISLTSLAGINALGQALRDEFNRIGQEVNAVGAPGQSGGGGTGATPAGSGAGTGNNSGSGGSGGSGSTGAGGLGNGGGNNGNGNGNGGGSGAGSNGRGGGR